jgi:hypothetical protein
MMPMLRGCAVRPQANCGSGWLVVGEHGVGEGGDTWPADGGLALSCG